MHILSVTVALAVGGGCRSFGVVSLWLYVVVATDTVSWLWLLVVVVTDVVSVAVVVMDCCCKMVVLAMVVDLK